MPGYSPGVSTVEPSGKVSVDRENDGAAVVVLEGEHDLGTVPDVQSAIDEAGEGALVIDLGPATFVDSSILGAVLAAQRECTDAGRGFAVACDGSADAVRRVLELTGLQNELPVHPSREVAIAAALGGSAAP
jgi:anti-anti-sigma factor